MLLPLGMSGVADPGPIISSLWVDATAQSSLQLDGVVSLVDLKRIPDYLADADIAADVTRQIAYADRILLNKTDLVTPAEVNCCLSFFFFAFLLILSLCGSLRGRRRWYQQSIPWPPGNGRSTPGWTSTGC
jgi:hypothetical protein